MMDFLLEAWVSALIEKSKAGWMLGEGKPWQPGRQAEAVVCGIQRHTQHGFGCARGRDAAADSPHPGRGSCSISA